MEISVLRWFVAVARKESFSEVAHENRVAASSVSRAIAGLEKQLGVQLLHRSTRRCSLTEAGEVYLTRIEPLIDEMDQVNQEVAGGAKALAGVLRIAAPVAFGQLKILPLIAEFSGLHPEISFECLFSDETTDLIKERADLAFRLGVLEDSALVATRLASMSWVACASPSYLRENGTPRAPSELPGHSCLAFPAAEYGKRWRFRDSRKKLSEPSVRYRCVVSNALALRECAVQGMGIAVLPGWVVAEDLRLRRLVPVLESYEVSASEFGAAVWLVLPSRRRLPLKVRAFAEFARERLRNPAHSKR